MNAKSFSNPFSSFQAKTYPQTQVQCTLTATTGNWKVYFLLKFELANQDLWERKKLYKICSLTKMTWYVVSTWAVFSSQILAKHRLSYRKRRRAEVFRRYRCRRISRCMSEKNVVAGTQNLWPSTIADTNVKGNLGAIFCDFLEP